MAKVERGETVWKLRFCSNWGFTRPRNEDERSQFGTLQLAKDVLSDTSSDFPDSLWKGYSANFAGTAFSEVGWSNGIVMCSGRHLASAGTLSAKRRRPSCARLNAWSSHPTQA